jgi:hypothetical protein
MPNFSGLILDDLPGGIGIYVFVQLFVHHANGRRATACEAFNELDAVIAIGTNGNGIMQSLALSFAPNSSRRA